MTTSVNSTKEIVAYKTDNFHVMCAACAAPYIGTQLDTLVDANKEIDDPTRHLHIAKVELAPVKASELLDGQICCACAQIVVLANIINARRHHHSTNRPNNVL
jgi:hypothetical protein